MIVNVFHKNHSQFILWFFLLNYLLFTPVYCQASAVVIPEYRYCITPIKLNNKLKCFTKVTLSFLQSVPYSSRC